MSTAAKPARRRARAVQLEAPALGDGELPAILGVFSPPTDISSAHPADPAVVAPMIAPVEKKRAKRMRTKRAKSEPRADAAPGVAEASTPLEEGASADSTPTALAAPETPAEDGGASAAESLLTPEMTEAAMGAQEVKAEDRREASSPPAAIVAPAAAAAPAPRAPNKLGIVIFAGLAAFVGAFAGNLAALQAHPRTVAAEVAEPKEAEPTAHAEAPAHAGKPEHAPAAHPIEAAEKPHAATAESEAPAEKAAPTSAPKSRSPHGTELKPDTHEPTALAAEHHASRER